MNTTLTQNENRTAGTAANGGAQQVRYLTPPANIWETGDGYVLQVEMPGVGKDGLELTVENHELTIWGRRSAWDVKADVVYRESRPFDYRRSFELDPAIDASKITAKMEQGILTLTLPKAERVKPRKITVTD
jgi:HSP20 family protein